MRLIIHHWDTDGITSAALLMKKLGEDFENLTGPIGEFRFDDRIWKEIERAEEIYVVDFNVPREAEKLRVPTVFIDHHSQPRIKNPLVKHVNPVLEGRYYPSASFVVSEYLNYWNEWSALGVVGDIGVKAFEVPRVNELLKLDREDALKLVELIDSNYIIMNRKAVEEAVRVLLENGVKDILEYEPWLRNVEAINKEIERALANVEVKGEIAFVEFESPFNIISKVARRLVWEEGNEIAIVVNRNFHGKAQVYCRALNLDLKPLIEKLKVSGFNAGGKREVLGCICERGEVDKVVEVIVEELKLLQVFY
ncbi:DHH family phosphoesterase [Pyrococcus abyssi]|uniref:Phosphoesterase, recJ-like n=1 Tax=Pyrococcus abyssi (strain GE5 / Orsay) TaxID=272844 RepID=Q9UZH7_PYRAB|nr:DHH family phosphoesterase [Pyrococcus abyssi]CAB50080.1 Phosphoesterase, recJ-like [Pyrococcus abyssi GE5]CCE70593.1 TPA: hypothetical protein PAB1596 [Pyrococcus abyssi GE5]